jgi:hypothetical protein
MDVITTADVRAVALSLPRTEEHLIRDHIKFRVGKIVYASKVAAAHLGTGGANGSTALACQRLTGHRLHDKGLSPGANVTNNAGGGVVPGGQPRSAGNANRPTGVTAEASPRGHSHDGNHDDC